MSVVRLEERAGFAGLMGGCNGVRPAGGISLSSGAAMRAAMIGYTRTSAHGGWLRKAVGLAVRP